MSTASTAPRRRLTKKTSVLPSASSPPVAPAASSQPVSSSSAGGARRQRLRRLHMVAPAASSMPVAPARRRWRAGVLRGAGPPAPAAANGDEDSQAKVSEDAGAEQQAMVCEDADPPAPAAAHGDGDLLAICDGDSQVVGHVIISDSEDAYSVVGHVTSSDAEDSYSVSSDGDFPAPLAPAARPIFVQQNFNGPTFIACRFSSCSIRSSTGM